MLQNEQTKLQVLAQAGDGPERRERPAQPRAVDRRAGPVRDPLSAGAVTAMGFFATFWSWLNGQLATYIGNNTARLAAALEPAVVTAAVIYVMAWGYLHLTGQIEEPFVRGLEANHGARRGLRRRPQPLALQRRHRGYLLQRARRSWPRRSSAQGSGRDHRCDLEQRRARSPGIFGRRATLFSLGSSGFLFAGAVVVWCLMGLLCVYAMFLIALVQHRARRAARARSAVHRHAVFRGHPATVLGLDRAARELRADHHADGDGGRAAAADRAVLCRSDRRPRQSPS